VGRGGVRPVLAYTSSLSEAASPPALATVSSVAIEEQFWDLLGSWTGVEEQSPSPWAPAARTRAALTFKRDLGGTAVLQDYRQVRVDERAELAEGGGGSSPRTTEFLAHGVFLADVADPGTVLWWLFDSYGQAPEPGRGRWSGRTLELTRSSPRGSAHHRFDVGPDRLAYAIDLALGGQEASPFLRGRYERVSGH
jgi:hypothetical protein